MLASELYEQRWSWAAAAVGAVRSQLAPELRHLVAGNAGDVSVVLYGPTQVGKTTLLLTLLGVAPAHRKHVSDTLRAGRPPGYSSTAVPLQYRWSPFAQDWELTTSEGPLRITGPALVQRLKKLRVAHIDRVEATQMRPITIGLPREFRRPDAGAVMPHVLDLPGVRADGQCEPVAVQRLVRQHVPLADLVIAVVSAEKMRSLIDMLETVELDWLAWPERFRIVLTYAATQAYGTHPAFRNRTEPVSVAELRAAAADQLATFGTRRLVGDADLSRRVEAILYPAEFGDSRDKLTPRERSLFDPVFAQLLDDLSQQIGRTAIDDSRYIRLPQAASAVRAHYLHRRSDLGTRVSQRWRDRHVTLENLTRASTALVAIGDQLSEARQLNETAATATTVPLTPSLTAPAGGRTGERVLPAWDGAVGGARRRQGTG